jgi:hypothetical protein
MDGFSWSCGDFFFRSAFGEANDTHFHAPAYLPKALHDYTKAIHVKTTLFDLYSHL